MRYLSDRVARVALLVAVFDVGACASVYAPSTINAPLLQRAGEMHVEGAMAAGGTALTVAVAASEHLAVMGKYASARVKPLTAQDAADDSRISSMLALDRSFGELGVGAYLPNGPIRLEAFAGGGWGETDGRYEDHYIDLCSHGPCPADYEVQAAGTYVEGFFQGDVGYRAKVADFGLSLRVAYLRFSFDVIDGLPVSRHDDVVSLEPTAFVRLGYKAVRVGLQAGPVWVVGSTKRDDNFGKAPLVASPGFHLSLGLHGQFDLLGSTD